MIAFAAFGVCGRFPESDLIFLDGDYYVQYVQFIRMFWRNLLSGKSLIYSFEMGMGQQTLPIYAYYVLSPFNVLFVWIKDIDWAAFLAVIGRMMFAAGTFCRYCQKGLRYESYLSIPLSVAYALSGYSICFYFNVNLLDAMYVLPVLICVLDCFVRNGKRTVLTICYTYAFFVCFYSGYQLGIFSAVCFGLLLYYYRKENVIGKTDVIRRIGQFCLVVITAILCSAVITFPTATFLMQHRGEDVSQVRALRIGIADVFANLFMGQNYGIEGESPAIYCGLMVLILLPLYLKEKQVKRSEKIVFFGALFFLVLSSLITPLYLLMHAFDMPDGSQHRFSYMYSFLLLSIAARALRILPLERYSKRMFATPMAIAGIMYPVLWGWKTFSQDAPEKCMSLEKWECNLAFLGILLVAFLYSCRKETKKIVLFSAMLAECLTNVVISLPQNVPDLIRTRMYYDLWQKQADEAAQYLQEDSQDFYRVAYENPMQNNMACFLGYYGLTWFSTLENAKVRQTLHKMGYYSLPAAVHENGSTEVSRMLFGQRYRIHATYPLFEDESRYFIEYNGYALPIAYATAEGLHSFWLQGSDPFEEQNALIDTMLGGEGCEPFSAVNDVTVQGQNMVPIQQDEETIWGRSGEGTGRVRFLIPATGDRAYAYFAQLKDIHGWQGAVAATGYDAGNVCTIPFLDVPRIMEMGPEEDGFLEADLFVRTAEENYAIYKKACFAYVDPEKMDRAYNELVKGGLQIESFRNTEICGHIVIPEGRPLLFTTIPYEESWGIWVDGQRVPTFSVLNETFLAAEVMPGEHSVVIKYKNPYVTWGVLLGVIGWILWCAGYRMDRKDCRIV